MPPALPTPLTRLRRSRLLLVAVLLSGGTAISAGGITERASVRIQGDVDANWRGAYDILVRPPGRRLDLEATSGVVEPNFLGFAGAGGISVDDLERVRAVAGIDLAAPVAVVGYVSYLVTAPVVHVSDLPTRPTLFELHVEAYSSDGLRDVPVQSSIAHIVLGPADLSSSQLAFRTDLRDLSWSKDGVDATLPSLPAILSPIIGVDPVAEERLLGPSADFLSVLDSIADRASLSVGNLDLSLIPAEFEIDKLSLGFLREQGGELTKRPIVPIVLSNHIYSSLSLRLTVTQLGNPLRADPSQDEFALMLAAASDLPRRSIGATTVTIDSAFRPFEAPSLMLLWPGSSMPNGTLVTSNVDRSFLLELASRPTYIQRDDVASRLEIVPTGLVDPMGHPFASTAPAGPGRASTETFPESAYRTLQELPLVAAEGFVSAGAIDRPFHFAPFGTFDLEALQFSNNPLNYVPVGAYDPPTAEFVATPEGQAVDPLPMRPTLNPAGLLQVPPLALTDLGGAQTLRGSRPIDAIRVRVAGVAGYNMVGREKVERVAAAIAQLGLDVDIVAGSSPQIMEIYVPSYETSVAPPADLGYVRQGWTTLGAAERVETGLEAVNVALLLFAIGTALIFSVGLEILSVARRRREIAILRAVGWQTGRIAWWILSEATLGAAAIMILGALASVLAGGQLLATYVGAALGVALVLTAGVGSALAARANEIVAAGDVRPVSRLATAVRVRGLWTFAGRQVLAYSGVSVIFSLAAIAAAVSFAEGLALLVNTISATGPTLLSLELVSRLRPYQVSLVAISLAGSATLMAACVAFDRRTRRRDTRLAAALGWSDGDRRAVDIRRAAILAIPASLAAAGLTAVVAGATGDSSPAPLSSLAAGLTAILLVAPAYSRALVSDRKTG
jgi:hypothetical protein